MKIILQACQTKSVFVIVGLKRYFLFSQVQVFPFNISFKMYFNYWKRFLIVLVNNNIIALHEVFVSSLYIFSIDH